MRQKVRPDGLEVAARGLGHGAQDLEVLLAAFPAGGEAGEGEVDDLRGGHVVEM